MDDNQATQDGEVIEETEEVTAVTPKDGGAEVMLSLENLIKGSITRIEKLGQELRNHRQMMDDTFANDPTFKEHLEKAKETLRVKNNTRNEIMKQPSVVQLANKIKTMSAELKELQGGLSDYLMEYQRMAGVNEIEGEDGEVREIVNSAKLVKRSSSKKH